MNQLTNLISPNRKAMNDVSVLSIVSHVPMNSFWSLSQQLSKSLIILSIKLEVDSSYWAVIELLYFIKWIHLDSRIEFIWNNFWNLEVEGKCSEKKVSLSVLNLKWENHIPSLKIWQVMLKIYWHQSLKFSYL